MGRGRNGGPASSSRLFFFVLRAAYYGVTLHCNFRAAFIYDLVANEDPFRTQRIAVADKDVALARASSYCLFTYHYVSYATVVQNSRDSPTFVASYFQILWQRGE